MTEMMRMTMSVSGNLALWPLHWFRFVMAGSISLGFAIAFRILMGVERLEDGGLSE